MKGLFRSVICQISTRSLKTSIPQWGVDKSLLSKLRKQTGIPFINCKKALEKHDNNFDEAKTWLLEEAQKSGWARATKLQTRPMSQGLVGVLGDSKQVTILEVNCETDFVAKNEKFRKMVEQLVRDCSVHFENQDKKMISANKEDLNQIKTQTEGMSTLADLVAVNVGNIGENMALRRGVFLRADEGTNLYRYAHPSKPGKASERFQLGKFGAVVELKQKSESAEQINELGHDLCQHIVGMNPSSIGEYSKSESMKNKVEEKDVDSHEGEENIETVEEEEATTLVNQAFLLDSSLKVGDLLAEHSVEVKNFKRFACGEVLENE